MRYFQCSKDKKLKALDETYFENIEKTQTDGNVLTINTIKREHLKEVVCCSRRMRELEKIQYDHEIIQRKYIDDGMITGTEPKDTDLMNSMGKV